MMHMLEERAVLLDQVELVNNYHQVRKQFGFLPVFYNIVKNEAHSGREGYPLRPGRVS